ncbi:MAG: hypothetical protein U0802_21510 [Candidatus Binatia bacterium]
MQPSPVCAAVPEWLRGLWRRRSIRYGDGTYDDSTVVYWLQGESAFADIRIPASRPVVRHRQELAHLGDNELLALARQGGFAGWTELNGPRCHWHREIDFQPPRGVPDQGILHRGQDVLIEEGVHERYLETWESVGCGPAGADATLARRAAAASGGRLLVLGNVFLFARDRRPPLAAAANLAALAPAGRERRAALLTLLDCEISFGRCRGGDTPWQILLSTLPFREGCSLLEIDGRT